MKNILTLALLGILGWPSALACQEQSLERQMARYLFSPGIIMQHQERLNLTRQQEEAIRARTSDFQGQVSELQWDLERRTQSLLEMISQVEAAPDSVLAVFDGMIGVESRIKSHHMAMLLDIRRVLTLEQRDALHQIMTERLSRPGGGGMGGEGRLP